MPQSSHHPNLSPGRREAGGGGEGVHGIAVRIARMTPAVIAFIGRAIRRPPHRAVVVNQSRTLRMNLVTHIAARVAEGAVDGVDTISDMRVRPRHPKLKRHARDAEGFEE